MGSRAHEDRAGRGGRAQPRAVRLPLTAGSDIPLREVSGLAVGPDGGGWLLAAVGDRGPDVSYARMTGTTADTLGPWTCLDLSTLPAPAWLPPVSQAEAVAFDGRGSALVLIEDPALLVVLDRPTRALLHGYRLDARTLPTLDWSDPSSRGEGLLLLQEGHVLVVKEKGPAGLIEFGPPGTNALGVTRETLLASDQDWLRTSDDLLEALAWWPSDGRMADWSDAATAADGSVFVLSDQDRAIGRLELPLRPGDTACITQTWLLPDGVDKAEGLAFLPDGSTVVAVDRRKAGRNLFHLPPPAQWTLPGS